MVIPVKISYDAEAGVFIAENEKVGLVLESASMDRLTQKVKEALPELLKLNNISGYTEVQFETSPYTEALAG